MGPRRPPPREFSRSHLKFSAIEGSYGDINGAIDRSGHWLLDRQDPEEGGWAERRGDSPSTLNTAEVLLALNSVRDLLPPAGGQIRKAANFLKAQQTADGEEAGSWPRRAGEGGSCPDLLRTSLAVEALAPLSEGARMAEVGKGVSWLLGVRNGDGGWGFRRGAESNVLMTSFALSALLAVAEAEAAECGAAIGEGLAFLAAAQRPSGSFDDEATLCGVRTAYAALCLQRAERCHVSVYQRERERAVSWLEENPTAATKEVELIVEIDPDRAHRRGDYAFVFMTETAVVRLLSESPDAQKRSGQLVREAMEAMFRGMDPDGGFFGQRVFSWSTARATYALGAARRNFAEFPAAPRPPTPRRLGNFIVAYVVLTLLAVVLLSVLGVFEALQATVVMFLALVVLLGYGRLSEAGFLEALKALRPWPNKGGA